MKTGDLQEKGIFFVIGLSEPPININDSNRKKPQHQWKFAIMIKKKDTIAILFYFVEVWIL